MKKLRRYKDVQKIQAVRGYFNQAEYSERKDMLEIILEDDDIVLMIYDLFDLSNDEVWSVD